MTESGFNEKILTFLEKNSRLTPADLADMLGCPEERVRDAVDDLRRRGVICGFNTLINWDLTERDYVSALIEVKVAPQRGQGFDSIAERVYGFDEVKAVYLMSGGFDLTVIVEGRTIKEVALFVSDKLSPLDSVLSTATHFVLKKYKDHGIIIGSEVHGDERLIVSP
ncbi:MAG: Lrp/AsnC family transcriptional regulator [Clostridiales bacterium]|jgi:DNA-binding Lrp family transcriptional regulator|nr:Lrp/AsnC family transcriptional regulator [Clostridiales bacterium]